MSIGVLRNITGQFLNERNCPVVLMVSFFKDFETRYD